MGPGSGRAGSVRGVSSSDRADRDIVHTFAGGALDRSAHLRADVERMRELAEADATLYLPFHGLEPLVNDGPVPSLAWLSREEVDRRVDPGAESIFLGLDEGAARFAVAVSDADPDMARETGQAFRGVRELAPLLATTDASIVALGRSLLHWNASHHHCPRCGSLTVPAEAGHSRYCSDARCGMTQFPRTDPVVIMLIHREGRCLLGRAVRARRYPPGLHSCLAGYVEPGESIEEAVRRETLEEAGLHVDRVRYHSSQPWPFPSTLMIGCFAEVLPGEARVDPAELESVRWFSREELRQAVRRWNEDDVLRVPPPLTIAHQLARAWLAEAPGTDRNQPPYR